MALTKFRFIQQRRSGWRFDGTQIRAREMLVENVVKVFRGFVPLISEELALGLEIAQLKYQMRGDRHRAYCCDSCQFWGAQFEKEVTICAGKTRYAVQIIDFTGGQNGHDYGWQACDVTFKKVESTRNVGPRWRQIC